MTYITSQLNTRQIAATDKFRGVAALTEDQSEQTKSTDGYSGSTTGADAGIYTMKNMLGLRAGSAVNVAAVKSGLHERLDNTGAMKDAGTRFQETNFGSVRSAGGHNRLGGLEGLAASHSKNPLDDQGGGMRTSNTEMASDEPAHKEEKSTWESVKEFMSSVVGQILGGSGTTSGTGQAAAGTAGAVTGAAWGILTANTGSPEDKKNEANGIIGLFRSGKTSTTNENESSQLLLATDQEPVPDEEGNDHTWATPGGVNWTRATNQGQTEPTDEGTSSGGPINTSASGTGKSGSLSQPVNDNLGDRAVVSARSIEAIQIRLQSRINKVN